MLVKFWGTRGSIATPGADTIRYGGNTSCVQVTIGDTLLIFDCGTGLRVLGQALLAQNHPNLHGHIFISHTHWDHIQGMPFFQPFFTTNTTWDIYGPMGLSHSTKDILAGQMEHHYFPVTIEDFGADIRYHDVVEGEFYINENIKVKVHYLNHTALTCGYRIEAYGATLVYACDHEPYSTYLDSNQTEIIGHDQRHADFMKDADIVIHDTQYTPEEFLHKVGWGHSTHEYAVRVANKAHAKNLVLTHHSPTRTDENIDKIVNRLRKELNAQKSTMRLMAAAEGMEIHIERVEQPQHKTKITKAEKEAKAKVEEDHRWEALHPSLLLYAHDRDIKYQVKRCINNRHVHLYETKNHEQIDAEIKEHEPSLILVEHNPWESVNGYEIVNHIRNNYSENKNLGIVVLSKTEENSAAQGIDINEILILPVSDSYLKSKIESWLLKKTLRWSRASIPTDEAQRLRQLRIFKILDLKSDDRFDRITRIAAALFAVPVALINVMDANRQWVKSAIGLHVKEMPRDSAFCSHVVYSKELLVINNTLDDDRFADNPYVTGKPHVRFYAGAPLTLTNGSCIGTLCLIDTKPRILLPGEMKLLEDLRDLVIQTIEDHPNS